MTSEEILFSLYRKRVELEGEAVRKYQMGMGFPYTPELKEIDEQIKEISKRVPQSVFAATPEGTLATNPITNVEDLKGAVRVEQLKEKIAEDLTKAEKKKLCVLERLKDEYDLTPKTPVRTHMYLGYSHIRPADEAWLYGQKISAWIQECALSDRLELENILAIFQEKKIISKFLYSEQEGNLKIQFPDNFEERYKKYKTELLGAQKTKITAPNLSDNFTNERNIQVRAMEQMIGKERQKKLDEKLEELLKD